MRKQQTDPKILACHTKCKTNNELGPQRELTKLNCAAHKNCTIPLQGNTVACN